MVVKKHELEAALHEEHQAIRAGKLKEDNPLDLSENFRVLCEACRRGDLKVCQEKIMEGININGRDRFDYTPLILASLCGHYEVVQLLLESGALCERDTFQGERCLYNALNDRIRNLLLSYDYSKSTDPLQPLAAHITSLLVRDTPNTSDITITAADRSLQLHKFLLSARSPYFSQKLSAAPETKSMKLASSQLPAESLEIAIRYLYLSEVSADLGSGEEEQIILTGVDRLSKQLEMQRLFESIIEGGDRRLARQRRTEELNRGRDQLDTWFRENVLAHKIVVDSDKANDVRWDRNNGIFADVLLRADEDVDEEEPQENSSNPPTRTTAGPLNGIPIGPSATNPSSNHRQTPKSVLFPAHRAMLIRSEFFLTMFSSAFREAQATPHLQIIPIDCSPAVLEIVLAFLYTEKADFPLHLAIDVLFAADLLFLDKLKSRAAQIISTLGNGALSVVEAENPRGETTSPDEDAIDVYDVIRAGWDLRVQRLEEFGARFIAHRLERYIDEPEFVELVGESAARTQKRQDVDSVELVDDIRYYLSERFRLRFEDAGIEEMMEDDDDVPGWHDTIGNMENGSEQQQGGNGNRAKPDAGDVAPTAELEKLGLDGHDAEGAAMAAGMVRTLDGEIAGDEFAQDAINYQILLGKLDKLLESLGLDA
ncbi:hypothetical protein K490DRAFT_69682 [Saccharata proteae CBS 121410]|uniref:BTB domain-containing protein n=1 Tax=Saccharata proteae CBS 121410 TaxID=1314787 RepID=A0A9P4HPG4_9PEZI|nr:hypothetical protein K490DRAFT_69682 [Saccharata proteae CBS 121410]